MNEVDYIVFQLLKESLFPNIYKSSDINEDCEWKPVYIEMQQHAVASLTGTWLKRNKIPDVLLYDTWYRQCLIQKSRWVQLMCAQEELLNLLEKQGIKCVIIKGSAAGITYPQPSLRETGDIDFLVSRKDYANTAKILEENGYQLLGDKSLARHHYGYIKNGIVFELHRRLSIISETDEKLLLLFENGIERREMKTIGSFSFPILPSDLNGLVLLFHINQHLRNGIGLRHIIDWMMYLDAQGGIESILPLLRKTKMERFARAVTVMCQKYLGLRPFVQDTGDYHSEELMEYILSKGNFGIKSGEDGEIESFFLNVSNPIRMFWRLQTGGMLRWKAAKKYGILKPVAWLYQLIHIVKWAITNKVNPSKLHKLHKVGTEQRELIKKVGLDVNRIIREDGH